MKKFILKTSIVFLLTYLFILGTHGFWLRGAANLLIIEDPIKETDLLVVSTGSYSRFRYAVELMKKGYGKCLLILGDSRIEVNSEGKTPLHFAEKEAVADGIPREKLLVEHSTSTRVDAKLTQRVMLDKGFKSGAVVSDGYNMRRMAMIFDHAFKGTSLQLSYLRSQQDPPRYHPDRWWEFPDEFVYVVKEWIKLPVDFFYLVMGDGS